MQIQNPEATQTIRDEAKLTLAEGFPDNLLKDCQAVMDMTPSFHKTDITLAHLNRVTSGAQTIFTSSSTRETYVTAVTASLAKDATCDVGIGAVTVTTTVNGLARVLASIAVVTTTLQTANVHIIFKNPIKIDKNVTIAFGTSTYTLGTMSRTCAVFGYEQ